MFEWTQPNIQAIQKVNDHLKFLSDSLLERYKSIEKKVPFICDNPDFDYVEKVIGLIKGRVDLLPELWTQGDFFFKAPESYSEKDVKKRWSAETPEIMEELIGVLEGIEDMSSANAEKIVLDWIAKKGYHLGNVMNAFRLAVVGSCRGPHMFDITELMPKEEVISRIRKAIETIPAPSK